MADDEFAVPMKAEDLLHTEGSYCVDDVELSDAIHALDGVVDQLCDHSVSIAKNRHFDVLYALIRNYGELSSSIKSRVLDVLMSGLSCLSAHIDLLSTPAGEPSEKYLEDIRIARNALKMHVYLLKWMMSCAEKEESEAADSKMPTVRAPKGATKAKEKSATSKKGGRIIELWQWESLRPKLLCTINNAMLANLARLWSPRKPDEPFCSLLIQSAIMAISSVAGCKDKDARAQAIKMLLSCSSRYEQRINVVTSVCGLMHSAEHASTAIAELVASAHEAGDSALVKDIMEEISRIPMAELARDSGAAKSVSSFITDVSELAPGVVLLHLEALNPHLQHGESYLMRNAILHAIGRTLVELASITKKERTDTAIKTREILLQILRERMHDINAFTRSKVLQVWSHMCEKDAIPKKTQPAVVTLATARLEDKSAQVRKSAIQLLKLLVQKNPYAHNLALSVWKTKLAAVSTEFAAAEEAMLAAVKVPEQVDAEGEESSEDKVAQDGADCPKDRKRKKQDSDDEDEEEEAQEEEDLHDEHENVAQETHNAEQGAAGEANIAVLQSRVNFYTAAVTFISTIHQAVTIIESLLRSKTTSDVVEAIEFLVAVFPFQMEVAEQSVRKMLLLVWSKETSIKETVAEAYRTIFLSPLDADPSKAMLLITAKRLCELVRGGSVGELTSLEHIMAELAAVTLVGLRQKAQQLPGALLSTLWELFASQHNMEAATFLTLSAATAPTLLYPKLRALVASSAVEPIQAHPVLARCLCLIWLRLGARADTTPEEADSLARLAISIIMHEGGAQDDRWLPAAEQAINTVVAIHPSPQVPLGNVVRSLLVQTFSRSISEGRATSCEPWRLARLLFCGGHVAVKLLACVEGIAAEQARKMDADTTEGAAKPKAKDGKDTVEDDLESAMGPVDAAVQESRAEVARDLGERDLSNVEHLVGLFRPMLRQVCLNTSGKYSDSRLRSAAILSLCKFMCVSSDCCEENLQLLFSIMVAAPEPSIRSNIVVALGDMAFRWTNLTEPWMPHIYALLRDADVHVRHSALTVLTHLVLNDMVKVRGQVSEMALCLEDTDERIQDMARLFLNEFKVKQQGMLLYNLLPDMIGRLSAAELDEGVFRRVVKFVFAFIDKAKQTDGLVDKLCQRFRSTDNPRQWRDVAFCLSQLTYAEKSVRKLCEDANIKTYADKLHDDDIYNSFLSIIAKAKKLVKTAESKGVAEELEEKISIAREQGMAAVQACPELAGAADASASRRPPPKSKKGAAKKGRGKKHSSDEEEEDEEDERPVRKAANNKGRAKKQSSDEEEEEEVERRTARKPAAKKGRGKKQVSDDDGGGEEDDDQEEHIQEKPARKPAANRVRAKKVESSEDEDAGAQDKPVKRPAAKQAPAKAKKQQSSSDEEDEEDANDSDGKENKKTNVKARASDAKVSARGSTSSARSEPSARAATGRHRHRTAM